jgi:hypothetical protein
VGVGRPETTLFVLFLPFYFAAFGLYQFMVVAVNRRVSESERIPHSLFWHGWSRVRDQYRTLYPRSVVYPLALASALVTAALAVAFLILRVWEYTHGMP